MDRSLHNGKKTESISKWKSISVSEVTNGIPFKLFINELPDGIDSELKIFADDTKVYKDVRWHDTDSNFHFLFVLSLSCS